MKRAFQILSVLLVLLLGTGPAWAALSCASNSEMAPGCPMGMSSMDADCPMANSLASATCSQDCCEQRTPTADVLSAFVAKPSPVKALLPAAVVTLPPVLLQAGIRVADVDSIESSPPRYILLRVFRI